MVSSLLEQISTRLEDLQQEGLFKAEHVLSSPQHASVKTEEGRELLNFCANNYLGLSNHPELVRAASSALEKYGFGMSSVRFICGTQTVHKQLETRLSEFLGMEETILYSSCFDANAGLFETLLGEEDAVISDSLNHASIIDGIRLCKAQRFRYQNNDLDDLEAKLEEASNARHRMIVTDGVFSMDGIIAKLPGICDLAEKYNALVAVDDSHAVGFMGEKGRGTHEHHQVMNRVDLITGTLGKALGGASGGYTSGKRELIEWLRQRSRPYLFSNTLAPVIAATSLTVLDLLENSSGLRKKLHQNTAYFRKKLEGLGFQIVPGEHPILPVMLGDAKVSQEMASRLFDHGIYAVSFSYPVVPREKARIRLQMSAAHEQHHLDRALDAFAKVGRQMKIIPD